MFDGEMFGKQMVEIVKGYVDSATAPLLARIDELERRGLLLPEKGEPGKPGEPGEKGEPGEVDMEAIAAMVAEAVAALPPAEKGDPGEPGQGVDMVEVATLVETAVKSAVEALPAPKDGEPGKDGLGLANALIDRQGDLILTMTDGTQKSLGLVVGKDGEPGKDGTTFTLDDFDVVPIDERTIKLGFVKGDTMHSFELEFPVLIGRGIWAAEGSYSRGDVVTWGGSAWEAVEPEKGVKPDLSKGGWRLLAKRGRDGKDAPK